MELTSRLEHVWLECEVTGKSETLEEICGNPWKGLPNISEAEFTFVTEQVWLECEATGKSETLRILYLYVALLPTAEHDSHKKRLRISPSLLEKIIFLNVCDSYTLPKRVPVTGRTSASKTGNAQLCWAYPSFLQRFRPLVWLSHSLLYSTNSIPIFSMSSRSSVGRLSSSIPLEETFSKRTLMVCKRIFISNIKE